METREKIKQFIEQFIADNGYSPSLREIGEQVGLSPSNVKYHLVRMRESGVLVYHDNISRSIRVTGA